MKCGRLGVEHHSSANPDVAGDALARAVGVCPGLDAVSDASACCCGSAADASVIRLVCYLIGRVRVWEAAWLMKGRGPGNRCGAGCGRKSRANGYVSRPGFRQADLSVRSVRLVVARTNARTNAGTNGLANGPDALPRPTGGLGRDRKRTARLVG